MEYENNMQSGFVKIPRSLLSDPRYKAARFKYKHYLLTVLENVAFSKTIHSIGPHLIPIQIGQLCISIRNLVNLCNSGIKFKDEMLDKNIVERASRFWTKCGFMRQEVRHGKMILTITIPGIYDQKNTLSETLSETEARQKRDIKEEDKENKEDYHHPQTPSSEIFEKPRIDLMNDFFEKEIEISPGVVLLESQFNEILKLADKPTLKKIILRIKEKYSDVRNWYSLIKKCCENEKVSCFEKNLKYAKQVISEVKLPNHLEFQENKCIKTKKLGLCVVFLIGQRLPEFFCYSDNSFIEKISDFLRKINIIPPQEKIIPIKNEMENDFEDAQNFVFKPFVT